MYANNWLGFSFSIASANSRAKPKSGLPVSHQTKSAYGAYAKPRDIDCSSPFFTTKKPSDVLLPVTNGASYESTSEVRRFAASASVLANNTVGTSITSAASRAETSFWTASCVGTRTLPPIWPHFFTAANWSSKCAPAAPFTIIFFISSNEFSTPPKPASASATIGRK